MPCVSIEVREKPEAPAPTPINWTTIAIAVAGLATLAYLISRR